MRVHRAIAYLLVLGFSYALCGQTRNIDFEDLAGPSIFDSAQGPLQVLSASFTGGEVLTNATFLPADQTSVYGTSFFCNGCLPTITIQFNEKVSNFSAFVANGQTFDVTYTLEDDQGNLVQNTLPSNNLGGAGVFTLPVGNIRQLTITGSALDWDFFIDNVSFTPSDPVLIDPVASQFLTGPSVSVDPNLLASGGTIVRGVSADGLSQAVLRIPAAQVGQTFSVSVINDQNTPSASTDDDGGLMALGGDASNVATTLNVAAVNTSQGAVAFAIYRAPLDFARGSQDDSLPNRSVTLQITSLDKSVNTPLNVLIVRPPVILIHGLWADVSSWLAFAPLFGDSRFFVRTVHYSAPVTGITDSVPAYDDPSVLQTVRENALGFAYNAPHVLDQIHVSIAEFRDVLNVAAIRADVVAHSMGGDIARTLFLSSNGDFNSYDTFGAGPINKLITIGTPHLGTPLATQILDDSNACVRELLAKNGSVSLKTITIGTKTVNGAVGDLEGDGKGAGLSSALDDFQSVQPFPTAYVAGIMDAANLSGVDCTFCHAFLIRRNCKTNPLAQNLTSQNWPAIFGQDSDAIVPLSSQLNSLGGLKISGVVHSGGAESLDFKGPSELDQSSTIPGKVIDLLNEKSNGIDFHR